MLKTSSKKRMKKRGQSTLEYLVLVAIVVAVFIAFLGTTFKTRYNKALDTGAQGMEDMAERLKQSRNAQP